MEPGEFKYKISEMELTKGLWVMVFPRYKMDNTLENKIGMSREIFYQTLIKQYNAIVIASIGVNLIFRFKEEHEVKAAVEWANSLLISSKLWKT